MVHELSGQYCVIDPWFGRTRCPIEFDMGCGFGRFTLDLAMRFPDRLVLGSDLHPARLAGLVRKARFRRLENVEALYVNNLALVGFLLPDASIWRLHLLCPDPWPKERHRGRRLMTTDFLARVARVLEPGGILHFSTDHAPYLDSVQEMAAALPSLTLAPEAMADIADMETGFERLWRAKGKAVPHLAYRKAT